MLAMYIICIGIAILNIIDAYQTAKYVGKTFKLKTRKILKPFDINPIINHLLKGRSRKPFWILKITASLLTLTIPIIRIPDEAQLVLLPSLLFLTLLLLIAVTSALIHASRIEKTLENGNL